MVLNFSILLLSNLLIIIYAHWRKTMIIDALTILAALAAGAIAWAIIRLQYK
jgi:hypothetical protein